MSVAIVELARLAASVTGRPTAAQWRDVRALVGRALRETAPAGAAAPAEAPAARRARAGTGFRDLVRALEAARSRDDLARLGARVALAVAQEELTPQQGQAITGSIRTAANVLRALPAEGSDSGLAVLVCDETADLAELYEGIVDGGRRAAARAEVARLAAEDAARYGADLRAQPGAVAQRMVEDGLDPWGDPA